MGFKPIAIMKIHLTKQASKSCLAMAHQLLPANFSGYEL